MSLGRWPLNANELDACCRCARLLPPARTRAIDSLEQLTDDELDQIVAYLVTLK